MIGAIIGDIVGSVYERARIKTTDFPLFSPGSRFTDDTVLTAALADSILSGTHYEKKLKEYFRLYPRAGYGGFFIKWASSAESIPYNSFGNGSAMRVSPVGFAYDDLDAVLREAERSAAVTHNHPAGIRGAQATASAIFLARKGKSKGEIKGFIEERFAYDLSRTVEEIRPGYTFNATCQGSVPEAIVAFLDSSGFEDAIRLAVSLGGDSDTQACIAGGIAQAFYRTVPADIEREALGRLDERLSRVVGKFRDRYGC